jgi:hypothetical protein
MTCVSNDGGGPQAHIFPRSFTQINSGSAMTFERKNEYRLMNRTEGLIGRIRSIASTNFDVPGAVLPNRNLPEAGQHNINAQ